MNMRKITVIDAPSILGLHPTGVERLPEALKAAGIVEGLGADYSGQVTPPPYSTKRDERTLLLNADSIRRFSCQLADKVSSVLTNEQFPIVLGGDCSILLGNLLALRRLGRYGLFFIDGHADFYQPEASLTGEVADMDLAIVSGRGPDILTNIDGLKPLVRDQDIILFGYRDAEQAAYYRSQDVRDTDIHVFDLAHVKEFGIAASGSQAVQLLLKNELDGFWTHLDADVLDDSIMPAVDYRLDGGLSLPELSELLKIITAPGRAIGMDITIFNPNLDFDGSIARKFVTGIVEGLVQAFRDTSCTFS
jgi:arginase